MLFFVGTYINDKEHTAFVLEFDVNRKTLEKKQSINAGYNPSFISYNAECDILYAVNELTQESDNSFGFVSCLVAKDLLENLAENLAKDPLKNNNSYTIKKQLSTDGDAPCHIHLAQNKKLLFVTNYGSDSLLVYSLQKNGMLDEKVQTLHFSGKSIHNERQCSPHPHETLESACGTYLYMTDLGRDKISILKISKLHIGDEKKAPLALLDEVDCPEGRGPRHMALSDCQKFMYVSAELSSSVLVFSRDMLSGTLTFLQECRIFADEKTPYPRTAPSEISFHKQKIYIANRGDNSISILNQNKDGTLSLFKTIPCKGENPRHFKIYTNASPNNSVPEVFLFVLNQNSNTITIFEIDDNDIHYCNTFSDIEKPAVMVDYKTSPAV